MHMLTKLALGFTIFWVLVLGGWGITIYFYFAAPALQTPAINAAINGYSLATSVLHNTTGYVEATEVASGAISREDLLAQITRETITGWTKGLAATEVGGLALATNGTVPTASTFVIRAERDGRTLALSVPEPTQTRLFNTEVTGNNCQDDCIALGSMSHGTSYSKDCTRRRRGSKTCTCHCQYRRWISKACYLVQANASTGGLQLAPNAGCYAPHTVEGGHLYQSRNPGQGLYVRLRTADDPLITATDETDGTLELSHRPHSYGAFIGLSISAGITGIMALAMWVMWCCHGMKETGLPCGLCCVNSDDDDDDLDESAKYRKQLEQEARVARLVKKKEEQELKEAAKREQRRRKDDDEQELLPTAANTESSPVEHANVEAQFKTVPVTF